MPLLNAEKYSPLFNQPGDLLFRYNARTLLHKMQKLSTPLSIRHNFVASVNFTGYSAQFAKNDTITFQQGCCNTHSLVTLEPHSNMA